MNSNSSPDLPTKMETIRDVAGLPAALLLMKERGGVQISIPEIAQGSALAKIVGIEAAELIVQVLPTQTFIVPFGPYGGARQRRNSVRVALAGGASVSEAALQNNVHMRSVKRVKAALKKPDDQPTLFKNLPKTHKR